MAQNLPRTWLYLGERQYRYQWLSDFIQELKNRCVTWIDFKSACDEVTWVLKKHKVNYPDKKSTETWASYANALLNRLQELSRQRT